MNTNILFSAKLRTVAFVLIIAIIAFMVIAGSLDLFSNEPETKQLLKNILMPLMCLALFLIQFSKYKDDDEMMLEIRLKLVMHALLVGTLYLIFSPILDYFIFNDEIQEIKAGQIIMVMLFFQIFMFQMKRYSLRKELSEN